jgi:hypothetical protein
LHNEEPDSSEFLLRWGEVNMTKSGLVKPIVLLLCIVGVYSPPAVLADDMESLPIGFLGMVPLEAICRYPAIRAEIRMTEEQRIRANQLLSEYAAKWRETATQARNMPAEEATPYKQKEMDQYRAGIPHELKGLLEADQHARLQEVTLQMQIRHLGLRFLNARPIKEVLGLSSAEAESWRLVLEREEQRRKELDEALFTERAEAILSILTREQRDKFDLFYGEPYSKRWSHLPSFTYDTTLKMLEWGPSLDLIRFSDNRGELEVIDEQYERITVLLTNYYRQFQSLRREFNRSRRDELRKVEIRKAIVTLQEESEQQLRQILLPHQFRRLEQIIYQARVHEQVVEPLLSPLMADALTLTDLQREKIRTTILEKNDAARTKKDELWREVLSTAIESLTPEQQAKYFRLVGRPFEPMP